MFFKYHRYFCNNKTVDQRGHNGSQTDSFESAEENKVKNNADDTKGDVISAFCFVDVLAKTFCKFLYKKFVRFDNYSVIVTSDKIITCGKGSYTEINSLLVTDLTDVKVGKNYATLVAQKTKIKIYLKNPEAFRDLIQSVYDNAQ